LIFGAEAGSKSEEECFRVFDLVLDKVVDGDASRPGRTAGPSLKHKGRGCRRTDADQSLGARIWSGHLRRPIAALYSKEHMLVIVNSVVLTD
jgi:hypothetical protein